MTRNWDPNVGVDQTQPDEGEPVSRVGEPEPGTLSHPLGQPNIGLYEQGGSGRRTADLLAEQQQSQQQPGGSDALRQPREGVPDPTEPRHGDRETGDGSTTATSEPRGADFDAESASYRDLQSEAKRRGVDASGTTDELRQRLR